MATPRNKTEYVPSTLDDVVNWVRQGAIWPILLDWLAMMHMAAARYDQDRLGVFLKLARAGTLMNKMAPVLRKVYNQMPGPPSTKDEARQKEYVVVTVSQDENS
ncbi:hypothetical protein BC827DRAFT_1155355 [Russula dissimulans]|nr:hypothetical protein BC827DRAFT_1155355 [Russula dissimulans]